MLENRIYSFLGLARKANKLAAGYESCERLLKAGKAELVIVAEDASQNTKKKFIDACNYRKVDIRIFGKKELLGKFIGKDIRSVIAVLDRGFAKRTIELIDEAKIGCGGEAIGKKESL
ncbi:MAG TPA: 50S ribosomal protein L7ae [Hungateiclostridium thermocellum]|uniref:Ribosomal protein L7Ae/L30e/S12e/Gadd45 n=2 Tax=Acetivibrio thermocellus TaxID=1515 RepID=A3DE45_ACET2|nr:ribosomal L7Ae/L30e/S12e/Gadd45 family protein [Acetivibrio thermocellus]CDG35685.1 50S ribosomal protein L7AE [Acetivibrio thermocellus BC1]ABN52224.1 ribosomal protein L7Ae/L30e/S12e/Gadd45 [Acetivibrio thermocellus ATCC 27405]ADU74288.1 ribosomal protein L7Ae/L30e/S12e/Gadd45 [Acetivibrio thermocellus DSM 1313]ALX08230.1 ribosomal protein L7Ae/L30e/S12e/Gadd45 [Acetivibrio thermocellus AD2]ANV75978.1 ribosomal protein L7Ae/L30e/S12e/Gadd45 [Acetivibrio thermocellus DSM 2360]